MIAQNKANKVISPVLLAVGTILMGVALYFDLTQADIAACEHLLLERMGDAVVIRSK